MVRHSLILSISLAAFLLVTGTAPAQVLLSDDFNNFDTAKWTTAPYLSAVSPGYAYLGYPRSLTPITLDGNNMLRMTSIMTNFQRHGIGSIQSFNATAGAITVDFKTMPFNDPSVPAANQFNIDGLLDLYLVNPTDGRFVGLSIFASHFGDPSHRLAGFGNSFGQSSNAAVGWQYNTYYRFVIDSDGSSTHLSFRTAADSEILGQTYNFGFGALGNFNVTLSQPMGIPNAEFYSDAAVDRLVFTAVPEPGSLVLCGVGVLGCAMRRYRRTSAIPNERTLQ